MEAPADARRGVGRIDEGSEREVKMRALVVSCALVVLLATACNLGSGPDEEELPVITQPAVGIPSVQILSPQSGQVVPVDEQLVVRVRANDVLGVTRVQLFSNGQIVRTISSESSAGDPNFEGTLDFIPRTTGTYDLRVIAFRNAIASDPANVTITVEENAGGSIVVTERANGDSTIPGDGGTSGGVTIPNDGVCRALTTAGLNMREDPTTERDNVITVLPNNTLVPILSRLGDNSWWKVNFSNQVGWISAEFTQIYGNCSVIPVESVILNTPTFTPTLTPSQTPTPQATPTPGLPDLVVVSIAGERELTIPAGSTEVTEEYTISITNQGAGPSGPFSLRIRLDGADIGTANVSSLAVNQSTVITRALTFDTAGEYAVRIDLDPDDLLDEISEINNRGDFDVTVESQVLP